MSSLPKVKGALRKILPFLFLISMLVTPISIMAQTQTSYPVSTSITFISYEGNDGNGALAFQNGQIAFYAQSIPPSEYIH